ncbi:MAG: hypothetical protein QXN10_04500 [Desulfurococcaceae archaeon]
MDMLSLAFYLSVLSYYTGTLLRAIPLPLYTVKKLGRMLMIDGVFSSILIFSYNLILRLIDYIGSIIGVNWPYFMVWLTERSSALFSLVAVLKTLSIALSKIGLSPLVSGFINPIINLAMTSLTTVLFTSILATIFTSISGLLIAIGILLHSIPFRLARGAGAMIMAITITFSIGLPLMPSFISMVSSNVARSVEYGEFICSVDLRFRDALDQPVGYIIFEGYEGNELIYRYLSDPYGNLKLDKYSHGFPCRNHVLRAKLADLTYVSDIEWLSNELVNITASLSNIISLYTNRYIALLGDFNIMNVTRDQQSILLGLYSVNGLVLRIYVERDDEVEINFLDNNAYEKRTYQVTWNGVETIVHEYTINPGIHYVNVTVNYNTITKPLIEEQPYITKALETGSLAPEKLVYLAVYSFMELTILPLVYIFILLSISYGMARLLGGTSSAIARIMVYV